MWQRFKSNIIKPVSNYFSGIFTRVSTFFTGESQRQNQYQPVPSNLSQENTNAIAISQPSNDVEIHLDIFNHAMPQAGVSETDVTMVMSKLSGCNSFYHNLFADALPKRLANRLLSLAADATQPAVNKLLKMLAKNPSLLREKGNVITRGGDEVRGVTVYEFCLGAGDPDLAGWIAPYFDKIQDGEAERERQYNRYKPYIDAMQTQAPYDLNFLIDIIINSPAADVTACLNKNFDHESVLNTALKQFRAEHVPRVITKPCMHYNYKTLELAFTLLYDGWNALSANETNYDKCRLVYRQIIGYLQRTLPGIDRIGFARAFQNNKRALNYIWADGRFSDVGPDGDLICSGLGFDEFIYGAARGDRGGALTDAMVLMLGASLLLSVLAARIRGVRANAHVYVSLFQNFCQTKTSNLQSLCGRAELKRPSV